MSIFHNADTTRIAQALAAWQDWNSGQVPPMSSIKRLCDNLKLDPSAEQLVEAWRMAPNYRRPGITERLNASNARSDADR